MNWKFTLFAVLVMVSVSAYAVVSECSDGSEAASDDSGSCGDDVTYVFDSSTGTLTISGSGDMSSYSYGGAPWYPYSSDVKKVVIEDGVTSIGEHVFYENCTSLTSVTIPDSVTSIGDYAFSRCISLVSVAIPDSVTSIGDGAFDRCSSLAFVVIGNGVTSIGDWAFYECTSLASVTIPDSVIFIGDGAFNRCTSLTSVTIPDSVTSIGSSAFYGCSSLTSVTIPDGVTSIDDSAFRGCTSLVSVTIPNSVTFIGVYAFEGCTSLVSVTIPDSVTSIDLVAFSGCTSLVSVTIPDSVTSIGYGAFDRCSSLTSIVVAEGNTAYCSVDGVLFSKDMKTLMQYPAGRPDDPYVIPDSVTSIGHRAFYGCASLISVTIPDNVTSIGGGAFAGCTSLTSIIVAEGNTAYCSVDGVLFSKDTKTLVQYPVGRSDDSYIIPDGVTSIGLGAFYECTSLVSVIIPDGVTSIGDSAFEECTSLTSIILPDSVTSIGSYVFCGCTDVSSIRFGPEISSIGNSSFEGIHFTLSSNEVLKGGCFVKTNDGMVKVDGHMMSFYVDGKVVYRGVFVEGDDDTSIPDVPFRPGYICSWEEFELGTEDISVNAVYVLRELTVSFDPNGGSGSMDPVTADVEHLFLRPENGFSAPDHMHFAGWAYSSDGEPIDFDGLRMVDDAVLYALWAWDQYDVVYKVDGEIVFTDTFGYGTEVTVREMYQKTGYTVTGWSTEDIEVTDGKFTLGASDVVFNAASTVNQYDVVYKVDGETVFTDTFDYGTEVTVRDMFQKTGYTVTEWSTDDVEVSDGKFTLGTSDVVFDATSTVNQYDVIFISDGKEFARYSLAYGSAVVLPDVVPSKDADVRYVYTFSGWDGYTDGMVLGDGDVTFTAVFDSTVKKYAYTVEYVDGDGNALADPVCGIADYGSTVDAEIKTITGYATPSGISHIAISEDESKNIARYVYTIIQYDVVYKVDGETVFTDTFDYGTEVTVRDIFLKTGYTVTEWSTDDVEVSNGKFVLGAHSVIFSAASTVNQYDVVYKVDGETVFTDTFGYGTEVTVRDMFQKTGYTVTEWSTDDAEVSDGKFVLGASDVVFDATSAVNQYDVVYKVDGETVFNDTFGYGTEVTVRDVFLKTGHTVTGWSTDDAEVIDGKFVLGASDVTFSAVSAVNKYSYTVEYVDGEGNAIADSVHGTADYGSTVDAEVKTIAGYVSPSVIFHVVISEDESKNVVTYVYTIIVYTITFDDGTVQTDVKYTVKDSSVDEPQITKKKGHTAFWEEYVLDLTDKTVNAVYVAESYHVEFVSDGAVFFAYDLGYGKEITLPSGIPSKDADVRYVYTFSGWDGYTDGMVLGDGDVTFTAVFFRTAAVAEDGSDLAVNVDEDNAVFSSDTISDVVSKAESDPTVTMTVSVGYGVVVFDNGSLRSLGSSEATLELYVLDPDDMTQTVRDIVGDNVAYSISFGPNKAFGSIVTVTVPYVLAEGKDPDNLVVYYVAEDGAVEEIPCTYSEGYVTFSTDHFSVYAVMYGEFHDVSAETVLLVLIAAMIVMPAVAFLSWRRAAGRSV